MCDEANDSQPEVTRLLRSLNASPEEDIEGQRDRIRDSADRLQHLGQSERLRSALVRDDVVAALADTLRETIRLDVPQVGMALSGTVDTLARQLGGEHRHTLTVRFHLAGVCLAAGEPERAITLYEQVVKGAERLLGPEHPQALTARHGLAGAYRAADDPRALPLYAQMVEDAARVLGRTHPDALSARNNLARTCESVGERQRARALYEELVRDAQRVLGEHHPYLAVFRRNLNRVRAEQGAGDSAGAQTQPRSG